jgi:hypothetical protein
VTIQQLMPSPEYQAAMDAHSAAVRAFEKVTKAYRERSIGDAEYLKGRDAYRKADKAFDAAWDTEAAQD